MTLFSRTDQTVLGRWWWTVDRGLLAVFLALAGIGVVLVAAASPPVAERIGLDQYHFVKRHMILLVPSLSMMLGLSLLGIKHIRRTAFILLIASLFAMVGVLIFGMEIKGAQRWLHLPGFSLQPSEFAKPAFIVTAAWLMAKGRDRPEFPGMWIAAGLYAVVAGLLLLQPDFGMTFVVTCCFLAMIVLAGLPLRIVAGLGVLALLASVLAYFTFAHVQSRIDRFLDPAAGDSYQVEKSLEAFANGGLIGTGPGQGTVKLSLPDAHADFIFSVAGEELGFVFILILISLYGYVLVRGFNRIMDSDNMFVILGAGGLLTMFGLQTLIHMGSALHLLPAKGMTLPLVSYGGSSLLAISIATGMLLALTRKKARAGIARTGLSIRPVGGEA